MPISTNGPSSSSVSNPWSALDDLFQDAVDRRLLSGAVAKVWHGGDLVHASTVGFKDVDTAEPMPEDAIFRLYSMTKPVTAAAMMALWDDGAWKPEDPIARFLPEFADVKVLAEGGAIDRKTAITIEHLMTHQAGFAYGRLDDTVDQLYRAGGVPPFPYDIAPADYLERLSRVPLAYEPGTAWRYSVSVDVQGLIIERITGSDLRSFMRSRLFEPLGMKDTDFMLPAEKRDRMAALYTVIGDTLQVVLDGPFAPSLDQPPAMASGGAGLSSTAADYGRFARMLHGGGALDGTRILSADAVSLMRRSHTPAAIANGGFGTAPHWLRPGYEYAYNGVVVADPVAANVLLGANTYFWDGAASSWFWSDPENDVVVVCLVHLLNDADLLNLQFKSRGIITGIASKGRLDYEA